MLIEPIEVDSFIDIIDVGNPYMLTLFTKERKERNGRRSFWLVEG